MSTAGPSGLSLGGQALHTDPELASVLRKATLLLLTRVRGRFVLLVAWSPQVADSPVGSFQKCLVIVTPGGGTAAPRTWWLSSDLKETGQRQRWGESSPAGVGNEIKEMSEAQSGSTTQRPLT